MSEIEWTIGSVLAWSKKFLIDKESATPRLDAELIISHSLKCDRVHLYTHFDKPLTVEERQLVRQGLQRRAQNEPIAYIIGNKEFFGRKFLVDSSTLIPRPDTELLVETAISSLSDLAIENARVLDIGAGTGCVGLSVALEFSSLTVDFLEVDQKAVNILRQNADRLQVANVGRIHCNDLFSFDFPENAYDLIISNPPYIAQSEENLMSPEVLKFEPKHALFAENNGLKFYKFFADFLPRVLSDKGRLLFEMGCNQSESIKEIFESHPQWGQIKVYKDLSGHSRVIEVAKNSEQEQLRN